jgi:hypothetical protein
VRGIDKRLAKLEQERGVRDCACRYPIYGHAAWREKPDGTWELQYYHNNEMHRLAELPPPCPQCGKSPFSNVVREVIVRSREGAVEALKQLSRQSGVLLQ